MFKYNITQIITSLETALLCDVFVGVAVDGKVELVVLEAASFGFNVTSGELF